MAARVATYGLATLSAILIAIPALGQCRFAFDALHAYPEFGASGEVAADFDGDGFIDMAILDYQPPLSLEIWRGVAGGWLDPVNAYPVSGTYWSLTVGDFNGDGREDIAIMGGSPQAYVDVFLGNGALGFTEVGAVPEPFVKAVAADLDRDGKDDLVGANGDVVVLQSNGGGTFRPAVTYSVGNAESVAQADLNGDGLPDVVALITQPPEVGVLLGSAGGVLQPVVRYTLPGAAAQGLDAANLDGDGNVDVAVPLPSDDATAVLRGNGDGTLRPAIQSPMGGAQYQVIGLGDIDGDGVPDLAGAGDPYSGPELCAQRGRGDGTFDPPTCQSLNTPPYRITIADVDRDGYGDTILALWESLTIGFGRAGATLAAPDRYPVGVVPHSLSVGDADRDGVLDLAVTDINNTRVQLLRGDGAGGFVALPPIRTRLYSARSSAMEDFDGDGWPDIVVAGGAELQLLRGNGDGTFRYGPYVSGGTDSWTLSVGDLNGDGIPDLIHGGNVVLVGPGGTLSPPAPLGVASDPRATAIADMNGDGKPDAIVVDGMSSIVQILLGNGDGTFQPAVSYPVGAEPRALLALDCNGDGKQDVVTANWQANTISVLRGTGTGTLQPATDTPAGYAPNALAAADLDGDGNTDLAVVDNLDAWYVTAPLAQGTRAVAIMAGDGTGLFRYVGSLQAEVPLGIVTGDFDRNGTPDLAVASWMDPLTDLLVIRNTSLGVTPADLPHAIANVPYSALLTASGGTPPYAFSVVAGTLPPGISLDSSGLLSGLPTASGRYRFTVEVTDGGGCTRRVDRILEVGDGADYLVGRGLGAPNVNHVRLYTSGGTASAVSFDAYTAGTFGVSVAASDIDNDGFSEILTGPGPGAVLGPQVRAFRRDATLIAKVNFFAYGTLRYGVNVGSGDIDGDSFGEILTGAGPGAVFGPHVRGWNFDNQSVTAIPGVSFFAYGTLRYGTNVAGGDVDGDSFAEVLTGPGPSGAFATTVRGFDHDGSGIRTIGKINFNSYALKYGVNVAVGDADADGFEEIATAPGPGPGNASDFRGFDYDASALTALAGYQSTPFATLYGARVGQADIAGTGRWDLLCGAGRDPAATSDVRGYAYDGVGLTALSGTPFVPFPPGYGVNVAGGAFGM